MLFSYCFELIVSGIDNRLDLESMRKFEISFTGWNISFQNTTFFWIRFRHFNRVCSRQIYVHGFSNVSYACRPTELWKATFEDRNFPNVYFRSTGMELFEYA